MINFQDKNMCWHHISIKNVIISNNPNVPHKGLNDQINPPQKQAGQAAVEDTQSSPTPVQRKNIR